MAKVESMFPPSTPAPPDRYLVPARGKILIKASDMRGNDRQPLTNQTPWTGHGQCGVEETWSTEKPGAYGPSFCGSGRGSWEDACIATDH